MPLLHSRTRAAFLAFSAESAECGLAVYRLDAPTFQIVIAGVEHVVGFAEFFQVSGHGVFDQVVRRASGLLREFLQAGFGLGTEVDFHGLSLERLPACVKISRVLRSVVPTRRETDRQRMGPSPAPPTRNRSACEMITFHHAQRFL